jgi:hypothetical protein
MATPVLIVGVHDSFRASARARRRELREACRDREAVTVRELDVEQDDVR